MKDGIYFKVFIIRDGIIYDVKIMNAREVSNIMANSVMDGLGKVIGFDNTDHQAEEGK